MVVLKREVRINLLRLGNMPSVASRLSLGKLPPAAAKGRGRRCGWGPWPFMVDNLPNGDNCPPLPSQYAILAHLSLQINSLQGKVEALERENRNLQHQAAHLSSLDRVERIARHDLGMVPFAEIRYLPELNINTEIDTKEVKPGEEEIVSKLANLLRPKTALAEGFGQ